MVGPLENAVLYNVFLQRKTFVRGEKLECLLFVFCCSSECPSLVENQLSLSSLTSYPAFRFLLLRPLFVEKEASDKFAGEPYNENREPKR